jgi:D-alanyl-D-alanine carboxypeptidase (penicillin-binding protein 5/6)
MTRSSPSRRHFLTTLLAGAGTFGLRRAHAATWPSISAPSAILIDAQSGRVLFEKNADEARAVASTQKLLTAIIIAEAGGLYEKISVRPGDVTVEPTRLGIKPGQSYGRGYLMQAMLVKSCNDVARCLARAHSGSETAFGRVMTARAVRLGCRNSRFLNAHGLPAAGQHSTARDLALIARAAHFVPVIRQIVRIRELPFRYADGRRITLETTNKLMKQCPYVTGMKTGYTNAAGKCLVSSGESNGRQVISIVLGSSSKYIWDESRRMLEFGLTL